jgi:hypothetical protein
MKHGHNQTGARTRTYQSWANMLRRCQNVFNPRYDDYGGRHIEVCKEWKSFENFLADMGECPEKYTIDRKDNNKSYCKENCHWVTMAVQNAPGRRRTRIDNAAGITGVHYRQGQWFAAGCVNGNRKSLYRGPNKEAAIAARKAWEDSL